jgi:Zn-dependent protease
MSYSSYRTAAACPDCGHTVETSSLSCPGCGWLRHSAQLEDLARRAAQAAQAGDPVAALAFWQQALALLPSDTVQFQTIQRRIEALHAQGDAAAGKTSRWKKGAAGAGPAILFLLAKGKLLLLGLTKIGTLLSMFAFFGVYWSLYGWKFALGFVLAIYIHEMGHVTLLRRYGIQATAPLFIPGLGAMIGVSGGILDPVQDSRVGLAGPIYGLSAAALAFAAAPVTGWAILGAIAYSTAVINLFNLIPIWQLDGSRGLHSLTRAQRAVLLVVSIGMFAIARERMLLLVAAGLAYRLFTKDQAAEPDQIGLMQFAFLLVALPGLALLASGGHVQ